MLATSSTDPDRGSLPTPEPASPGQRADRAQWREQAASTSGILLFECTAEGSAVNGPEAATLLFHNPRATLTAHTADELPALLLALDAALADGLHVAGYLTYEAAAGLLNTPSRHTTGELLAWFGIYAAPDRLKAASFSASHAPAEAPEKMPLCFELETDRATYFDHIAQAQRFIADGDTYQVNLTTAVTSAFRGDVASLYTALAQEQPTAFSALLHTAPGQHILSFSPELLFRTETDGRIITRPMKGTAAASSLARPPEQPSDDVSSADWLRSSEKNRAEHIMIVDLLRNDLNRVTVAGSVQVDPLFAIEQYNTVLQMTSTIAGQLRPEVKLGEILRALLPAGSMTGAPKVRTTQIINALEDAARGVYSGAIGYAAPDGTAVFSVPIRTLTLAGEQMRMGVGGAIVVDSQPEDELAECWLKCAFLHRAAVPFQLLESFRWDGAASVSGQASSAGVTASLKAAEDHLDRIETSSHRLGFHFDRLEIRDALASLASTLPEPQRIRLVLDRSGAFRFEVSPLDLWPDSVAVGVSGDVLWPADTFLRHKTTFRPIYDREIARARKAGLSDILFFNERGELAEGAISSVFLLLDGRWFTPGLSTGLLPGVARSRLLRSGQVTERILTESDLRRATAVAMANGVRGSAQVRRILLRDGTELLFAERHDIPVV